MAGKYSALLAPSPGPGTLKTRRWGGTRLARLHSAPASIERPIGESWEFSTLPGSESRCAGMALSEVLQRQLPFLAKLIDTALPLSIQVHPDDDAPRGVLGKEEAWVILDAEPTSELLVGLRPNVSGGEIEAAIRTAATDPNGHLLLQSLMHRIPARRGTVVIIPAGMIHSIGAGILLAEIQQPTDCTFRLHDYGSGRELQVQDGLAALVPSAQPLLRLPGETPAQLRGKHLTLDIFGPGTHRCTRAADQLLVALETACSVRVDGELHSIPPNSLRLVLGGHEIIADVPAGGTIVVGSAGALPRA